MEVPRVSGIVNGHYVRVIQCRRGASLLLEPVHAISVAREFREEQLERDGAGKLHILCEEDRSHSSGGERFEDPVTSDCPAHHFFVRVLFEQISR
jgi:hypothetical protein